MAAEIQVQDSARCADLQCLASPACYRTLAELAEQSNSGELQFADY